MRRRFAALMMLGTLLVGVRVGTADSVAASQPFTCPDYSCAFRVPDFYTKVSDDTSAIFKDADTGGTFTVVETDFTAASTLDDAVLQVTQQFSGADGFQADPAGVKKETLDRNLARSFQFLQNNSSGTQVKVKVFFSVYQGKLYLLSFATTPDQEDAFVAAAQDVFDSWQFT